MKKKIKLSIEKFNIAKLNNPHVIVGGDGNTQGDTITGETKTGTQTDTTTDTTITAP